ncbi:DUF5686 family protein [Antarcticibacterium sp. 1MA-6-2]|uniref:DUF5686 family protein n=1 Tax=Antarcticibacterium sp. 1MA-6-2 TaxID=2908210 RepID=UPI001F248498|nr:DUF5686 family protein [Antarcticibacterium sp. 1MA-6-2]UJH90514.1 DUF5686 family protein [Antarcticibacterium sp. 1MA-6-2]
MTAPPEPKEEQQRGRRFLSENVSVHSFKKGQGGKRIVEGISTAGLNTPAYKLIEKKLELPSLYKNDYPLFSGNYAGPLNENALQHYSYKILDTVKSKDRAAYVIYFRAKRKKAFAKLEGILMLDTLSYAIQYARLGDSGEIVMEAEHQYSYFEEEDLWFPQEQQLFLKPGKGGSNLSLFSGSIALGTVQKRFSILDFLLSPDDIEENLFLKSTTVNFDINIDSPVDIPRYSSMIKVTNEAGNQPPEYWETNRKLEFEDRDKLTHLQLTNTIAEGKIEDKIEIANGLSNGYYPIGFWNFDLSQLIGYNKYQGIRLGVGGETNSAFSKTFKLNGYAVYGFKDRRLKYGLGTGILLNNRTGTWFNLNYRNDIREIASHHYLKGEKEFALLEPRLVNINNYYIHEDLEASIEHRLTPRLESKFLVVRSDISQLTDYSFLHEDRLYQDYVVSEAKMSFLWRPFSGFINTPAYFNIYNREYPVVTGQISRSIPGMFGGDFDFTRLGLKAEYKTEKPDRSSTHLILEGNIAYGELPLTHAFHAQPNNANKPKILQRYAVAGKIAFETMYFNEFFSDRQAAFHIRHQLRPFFISNKFQPEMVLISRHVIGDFRNINAHKNVNFNTLEHGFSEAGLEINKIFLGFGLSTAYRYGAYHLPNLNQNISFKFTFTLQI